MLSRRRLLVAAATAAGFAAPARSHGETAGGGLLVLRARPAGAPQAFGYDGVIPGPTLRVKRGEELSVRLINELSEPTTIHWHGVRVPNAMDGVPGLTQATVQPGENFDYRFRPPDAGTFWYHAHAAGQSERGLYGALIVEEPRQIAVDREILLVLTVPAEQVAASAPILVNGSLRPDITAKAGERLRLRFVNACANRFLSLRFERCTPWLLAVDGQPAEPFVLHEGRFGLAPGGRIDLAMDIARDPGTAAPTLTRLGGEQLVARFAIRSSERPSTTARPDPTALPASALPSRMDFKTALRHDVNLGGTKPLDPAGPPLFTVRRGRVVMLALRNPSSTPHVVHVHGHSFRHLYRLDDGWQPYWLDTIMAQTDTERIAFLADNPGKWLITSRALDRPELETQAYFVVG